MCCQSWQQAKEGAELAEQKHKQGNVSNASEKQTSHPPQQGPAQVEKRPDEANMGVAAPGGNADSEAGQWEQCKKSWVQAESWAMAFHSKIAC